MVSVANTGGHSFIGDLIDDVKGVYDARAKVYEQNLQANKEREEQDRFNDLRQQAACRVTQNLGSTKCQPA
jgi:hypothetical protein